MNSSFRKNNGSFTPEAMVMYNEMQDVLVPFCKKWSKTFSQDEILSMFVSQTSLILSEEAMVNALNKIKKERGI